MTTRFISLVNGPNLNRLGKRQPDIYGSNTLEDVVEGLSKLTSEAGVELIHFQSNHEGNIIDHIQGLKQEECIGMVLNPGALMMNGYGLYDAILDFDTNVIEVHVSQIYKRESFRHKSIFSKICKGQITGLGIRGYTFAAVSLLENRGK